MSDDWQCRSKHHPVDVWLDCVTTRKEVQTERDVLLPAWWPFSFLHLEKHTLATASYDLCVTISFPLPLFLFGKPMTESTMAPSSGHGTHPTLNRCIFV